MTVNVQSGGSVCSSSRAVLMPAKPPPTMMRFLYIDLSSSRWPLARRALLSLDQARVAVGIPHDHAVGEPERAFVQMGDLRRYERRTRPAQPMLQPRGILSAQVDLPVPEIVRHGIGRCCTSGSGGEVLEQLDSRTLRGAQRSDAQMGAKNAVESLLLDAEVLARPGDPQAKHVAVEAQARVGVAYDDRRMVDAEKQPATFCVPLCRALVGRKGQQLEVVAIWVAEVERLDAARIGIRVRQTLRCRGGMLPPEAPQARVRRPHVAHDDRNVLEGAIVAVQVGWNPPAARREKFHELDALIPQPQPRDPQTHAEQPEQSLVALTEQLPVGVLPELEHLRVELDRPIEIAHCHCD